MASCLEVINRAHVKLGRLQPGRTLDTPRATIGLAALKSLYLGLVASGGLGRANTVYADGDYTAQEGDRIFKSVALTVTIPGSYEIREVEDTGYAVFPSAAGFSQEYRAPRDGSFVIVTDGTTTATSVYDAYAGAWTILETLALDSAAPFSADLEAIASGLAFELLDDAEQQAGQSIALGNRRFRARLCVGAGAPQPSVPTEYF